MTKKRFRRKSVDGDNCDPDTDVARWKGCLRAAYDGAAGCLLPWEPAPPGQGGRACNLSETHLRFTSAERRLWWDIDRDAAAVTGCAIPCAYELYHVERVPYEYEDDYSEEYNYAIQVGRRKNNKQHVLKSRIT